MSGRKNFIDMSASDFEELKQDYSAKIIKSEELYFVDCGYSDFSIIKFFISLSKNSKGVYFFTLDIYVKGKLLGTLDLFNIPNCVLQNILYFGENEYFSQAKPFICLSYDRYHKTWSLRLIIADKSIKTDVTLFMQMSEMHVLLKNYCIAKCLRKTYSSALSSKARIIVYVGDSKNYTVAFKNFDDLVVEFINTTKKSLFEIAQEIATYEILMLYMFCAKNKIHYN